MDKDFYHDGIFKKSEVIDGCLIRDSVFYGYIGTNASLVIPEGVMDVASFWSDEQNFDSYFRYIKYPIESIHFPATIDRILMRNMFSPISISHYTGDSVYKNYESLTKVYVSSNTVIEDGAFTPEIEIIRY